MIPKSAIKRYINEPRDDHRWLKKLSSKELDKLLGSLRPKPVYWKGLGTHQKAGLYLGILLGSFAYWYDMGTGKTLTSLELLQYWWEIGKLRRALIFVTSDKAFPTWERQIAQYNINIPFCALDAKSSKEKWRTLENFDEGLIIVHYPGTLAMTVKRGAKKGKWELDKAKIKRLTKNVDVVIYDEITKAGNTRSLTHSLCRAVSRKAAHRYGLAGMPFGRDPTPLWAQMYLIDKGATLGPTLGLFRAGFFREEPNEYSRNPFAMNYIFKERLEPKLSRMAQHRSLTYTADECIDLPPMLDVPEYIKLPPTTKAYYQELIQELIDAKGNMRAMKNAFHRMRQLSSGFLGMKDDETGERAEVDFAPNVKLERLLDLAGTFPENRKMLIYYQYTYSGRKIVAAFKEEFGINLPWLWSGTKDSRATLNRFIDGSSEEVPFCLINNQVGSMSLDGLQVANYETFYERPTGVIDYEQAKRRVRRQGQKHRTCFYYDLIVRGTVDERIIEFHNEGRDLFQAVLANPKALTR